MPYTPPSAQSPATSSPHTPVLSRSHSYANGLSSPGSPLGRPDLPRSASYLSRHRRTPSVTKSASFAPTSTLTIPESEALAVQPVDTAGENSNRKAVVVSGSLHQSPSPMNDAAIPSGAVISPPDSSQNSSDDESNLRKRRGRQLENLAELQAAIRIIEQHRESSPSRAKEETEKAKAALEFAIPALRSALKLPGTSSASTLPLSQTARKISHSRSSTESAIVNEDMLPNSAEDSDDENSLHIKPPLIRKKSGELVKPALRPTVGGRRRPSSMPGTPTYSKAVHFDSHLEHVRHFLQVDRPLAVSAGSSPVEAYESEGEFPFSEEGNRSRGPPFEWEIALSNFPRETFERKQLPVRVERVFLSSDNKKLVGNVIVANISFQKLVVVRFTLDYWKTTSEVVAEFNNDVRRKQLVDGYDRFSFNIKLADQANLENKTLFFCVRYNVNGQEFWDNNNSINFQVDFKKKALPQNGKHGGSSASRQPLPRSRPSPPVTTGRPKSMPVSFDDFADGFDTKYDFSAFRQPAKKIIGDSPSSTIRLKSKSTTNVPGASNSPTSQPFANRYDFGASLSAAISAANTVLGEKSGLKSEWKPEPKYFANSIGSSSGTSSNMPVTAQTSQSSTGASSASLSTAPSDSKLETGPASPKPTGLTLEKSALQSSSYHELLDKYCFFGSSKPSPQLNKASSGAEGQLDGAADDSISNSESSTPDYPPKRHENTPENRTPSSQSGNTRVSRSTSPTPATGQEIGSNLSSPVAFGYPYHHGTHTGFPFGDTSTPTAIRG